MQQSDELEAMRLQIAQGLLEHEIVVRALWTQALVSAMFVLVLGICCFTLWRRYAALLAAFHDGIASHSSERIEQVKLHTNERISLVKQHSLEQSSLMMQMLHAFEGIASRKRSTSGSSPGFSASPTPRQTPSTSSPTPPPMPSPPPTPLKRRPQ